MFSYFENRKTTYVDVFCLNFSIEMKIKKLFLISYFSLSKKTKWHYLSSFSQIQSLKFVDIVSLENCIFVNKCFNDEAFSLFSNHFKLTASSHSYCTRSVSNGLIFKRLYNTSRYGNKSIINSTVSTWNHFQTIFHGHNQLNMSPKKIKPLISKYFLRTMKNSLYVFTVIVNIYLIYEI